MPHSNINVQQADILYLKTRVAFDVLIHSRTLLAVLCWLATL